jgi:hypothetical protein
MENRKIHVLKLTAGSYTAEPAEIEDELEVYQKFVDGCIEVVRLNARAALVVNDEGLIRGLKENPIATVLYWNLCGRPVTPICGNAWIVGVRSEDGEFTNVPPSAALIVNNYIRIFKNLKEDDNEPEVQPS